MHAPEDVRVEPRLQVVQRPVVGRARNLSCNYGNRLVGQRGIDDFVGLYEHEPLADSNRDLVAPSLANGHHFDDLLKLFVRGGLGVAWPLRLDSPPGALQRYVEHLIACFGPRRMMWGSDWPVVNLAGGYAKWHSATEALLASLSDTERSFVMGESALAFYGLQR